MHKESLVVAPNKPRALARTSPNKTEVDAGAHNHTVNLHSRLPSADSGIQADGGFDSLSRYRGETFLSTLTSGRLGADIDGGGANIDRVGGDIDRVGGDIDQGGGDIDRGGVDSGIFSSSGYSSDLSHGSLPVSPKVVPLPSRSFVAASKPVPPLKPTLTSSPSKSPSPRPAARGAPPAPPLSSETSNGRTIPKTKPIPLTNCDTPSARSSGAPRQSGARERPPNLNQNVPASKPVAAQRTDRGVSAPHRQTRTPASPSDPRPSDPLDSDPGSMPLNVKVVDNDVEFSYSTSTISISSHSSSSDNSASLPRPARTSKILDLDLSGDPVKVAESSPKRSPTNLFTAPGTTLNLQVLRPTTLGRNQLEKHTNQGQGCIALTRPLRLGPPAKLSVKTVHATTLSPQPAHLVPVIKPSHHSEHKQQQQPQPQQQQQQPHQTSLSSVKPKPKIAPRPSVLTKTPSSALTSSSSVTTHSGSSSSPTSINTTSSQQPLDAAHKPEVPVIHQIKTVGHHHHGRTEIPVTHVIHRSASHKNQNLTRPPSLVGRHTPERDKHTRQQHDLHARQPIYENIRFDDIEGFIFDDADARMRHAELILKRSDDLISDALKMMISSPHSMLGHNGPFNIPSRLTDGDPIFNIPSRLTDGGPLGDEARSHREHRIPIFDARTGKFHSGARKSFWSEWTAGHVASTNGEGREGGVTWSDRKERIDSALTWLKHELADLRDMDTRLISQFQRCQDTIETLKSQRESWEGLSEEGEEGEFWEDYELNEYNRRYLDSPGGSSCSQFSPGSRQPSLQDVTLISVPVPQVDLPQDNKTANGQHGVTKDIEVTL